MVALNKLTLKQRLAEVNAAPIDQLEPMLIDGIQQCVDQIVINAAIMQRLQREGREPTKRFKHSKHLLLVASGDILPEIFQKYAACKSSFECIRKLCKADQFRVAKDDLFAVYDPSGSERMICPSEMEPSQIKMVFGDAPRVRTPTQQAAWITKNNQDLANKKATSDGLVIVPDPIRNGYDIRGFMTCSQMMEWAKKQPKKKRSPAVA
jgi:hypothetical protein